MQRWLPAISSVDWSITPAAIWRAGPLGGGFVSQGTLDGIELDDLKGIDAQKQSLVNNTAQFVAGLPANNALLWGARGTGKSSLVHALLNHFRTQGLRLIEIDKQQLCDLPELVRLIAMAPYRFVLFCDDLSFEPDESNYKAIKSALDGSVFRTTENILIYATSNRRHLLPESMTDNEKSAFRDGELHASEGIEEKISLSDRFGLWLSFYQFNQTSYLEIAQHWVATLSKEYGSNLCWNDIARAEALRWALARGVRSGRTAQHFARDWVGRHASS
jgi:predicted AAA+ superfamily ATPase